MFLDPRFELQFPFIVAKCFTLPIEKNKEKENIFDTVKKTLKIGILEYNFNLMFNYLVIYVTRA